MSNKLFLFRSQEKSKIIEENLDAEVILAHLLLNQSINQSINQSLYY